MNFRPTVLGTPNPGAAAQGIAQLAVVAAGFSGGRATLWPGWPFSIALLVGGVAFIVACEAAISVKMPKKAVTTIVILSGFLISIPLLIYAAWLRAANSGLSWIPSP